jgi:hypothetical protein
MKKLAIVGLVVVALSLAGFIIVAGHPGVTSSGAQAQGLTEKKKGPNPIPKDSIDELRAEIKKLQGLAPDQAAIMTHVGYHWSNLWFAVEKENWPLADFYLSETRANLKWAVRSRPIRKTAAGEVNLANLAEALDNTEFTKMKEAIGKKDKDLSIKMYDQAMQFCYACHKASEKPYLVPQRPKSPEVRVINFDPKATYP